MKRLLLPPCALVLAACTLTNPAASAQTFGGQSVTVPKGVDAWPSPSLRGPQSEGLFSGILADFKRLPSKDTLLILGIGAAGAAVAHPFDGQPLGSPPATVNGAFSPGNLIGSTYVQLGGALATYTLGKVTHREGITSLGADLFRAQVVTQAITQGIKLTAVRTRPDGGSYSFPSGHTASSFATASVIQRHFGWKAGIPAYGVAAYVAAARVDTRHHYLSDVAFGAAIGIMAGRTVTIGHGNARFAVVPAAAPGGGGVNFSWIGRK